MRMFVRMRVSADGSNGGPVNGYADTVTGRVDIVVDNCVERDWFRHLGVPGLVARFERVNYFAMGQRLDDPRVMDERRREFDVILECCKSMVRDASMALYLPIDDGVQVVLECTNLFIAIQMLRRVKGQPQTFWEDAIAALMAVAAKLPKDDVCLEIYEQEIAFIAARERARLDEERRQEAARNQARCEAEARKKIALQRKAEAEALARRKEEESEAAARQQFSSYVDGSACGDATCKIRLAECYEQGVGTNRDVGVALELYKELVGMGYSEFKPKIKQLKQLLPKTDCIVM